jgi:hypothetical protein
MSGILFWLMFWRVLNRHRLGTSVAALGLLALACSLFTAVLQVGWIWAYQGYNVSEVFDVYFTLALGIPAPVKILLLGLAIALAAASTQAFGLKAARP